MLDLEQARRLVISSVTVMPRTSLPRLDALGCVLAADVVAREDVPPFANTSHDGFAVRSTDFVRVPMELRIIGELRAGQAPSSVVGPGEAIRIMTGAPIPDGADAVVMVEDTTSDVDAVVVRVAPKAGLSIRPVGDDVKRGTPVLSAGTVLRPAHVGVLASLGASTVEVYSRPRVGVLSTGDELVVDDRPLRLGEIREANKDMLLAMAAQSGAIPVDLGVSRDDEASLRATLLCAIGTCDAVITSGGVSMGDYDFVKVVLDQLGEMNWMQIAIKPAKPFAFGLVGAVDSDGKVGGHRKVPVFGLPGNPVSSMVSFELLARPALRKMMGHTEIFRPTILAITDDDLRRSSGDGKTHWPRVLAAPGADGRIHVRSVGAQGSHQLASTASANAFACVPDGPGFAAGDQVEIFLLTDL